MSYKCNNCEKIYWDDFSNLEKNQCNICGKENSLETIDCIYCDEDEEKKESTHFLCEKCGVGMCDNCYDLEKEHDYHYHELCSSSLECDLEYNKQCEALYAYFGEYPSYICEKCLSDILEENKDK